MPATRGDIIAMLFAAVLAGAALGLLLGWTVDVNNFAGFALVAAVVLITAGFLAVVLEYILRIALRHRGEEYALSD